MKIPSPRRRALNNEFLNLLFSHSGPVRQKFIKILEILPLSFSGCQLSKFLPSKEMRALPEDDFTAHNIYMPLVLLTISLQLQYRIIAVFFVFRCYCIIISVTLLIVEWCPYFGSLDHISSVQYSTLFLIHRYNNLA